jgi:hypothetical protein
MIPSGKLLKRDLRRSGPHVAACHGLDACRKSCALFQADN